MQLLHCGFPPSYASSSQVSTITLEPDDWMNATYVPGLDGVCCVSAGGIIVRVDSDTGAVEPVGDFPGGIAAVCWSCDLEIVALITRAGTLTTMTAQWKV